MKNKSSKIACFADYILIVPDRPTGGSFDVGDAYIDETGVVEDIGALASDELKSIKGKRVIFNAWACDQKTVNGQKYYFAPESANVICAII